MGWVRPVVATLLGAALFLGFAEGLIRALAPPPRTQIIRGDEAASWLDVRVRDGQPYWQARVDGWREIWDPPCLANDPATTRHVALVGDSILNINDTGLPEHNVGFVLQGLLGDGWCVINLAQAGYSAAQKRAALLDLYDRAVIDQVIWEVWGEGPTYAMIGDDLYAVGTYARDAAGVPFIPGLPLPSAVNGALFQRSRLWEYAVLALAADTATEDISVHHRAVLDATTVEGADIAFFLFPDLKGPFGGPPRTKHSYRQPAMDLLAERDATVVDIGQLLVGQDHLAIRMSECCHYNQKGHAVLAAVFRDWLLRQPVASDPG